MNDRKLTGMGPQFEAPSADDNHRRVHDALRGTIRKQGEVTSLALANNALLWEERKRLKSDLDEARGEIRWLQSALEREKAELAKLSTPEHRNLHDLRLENEELKRINEGLKKALQLHLVEAIDATELKERFQKLEEQRKELEKDGAQPNELMREQDQRAAMRRAGIEAPEPVIEEEPPTQPG